VEDGLSQYLNTFREHFRSFGFLSNGGKEVAIFAVDPVVRNYLGDKGAIEDLESLVIEAICLLFLRTDV
jgi:hypothetical protein